MPGNPPPTPIPTPIPDPIPTPIPPPGQPAPATENSRYATGDVLTVRVKRTSIGWVAVVDIHRVQHKGHQADNIEGALLSLAEELRFCRHVHGRLDK